MHTASDLTRRSGNMTRWFRTYAYILIYAHRVLGVLRGANRDDFDVQRAFKPMQTDSVVARRTATDPWRKIRTLFIRMWHAHCKRLDAAFRKHDALVYNLC